MNNKISTANNLFREKEYIEALEIYKELSKNKELSKILDANIKICEKRIQEEANNQNLEITDNNFEQVDIIKESGLYNHDWYISKNQDLKSIDPIMHYCIFGHKENRRLNPLFDALWYRNKYLNGNTEINPVLYYILHGWKLGHSTSVQFNGAAYQKKYGIKTNPLSHFLNYGKNIGYKPINDDSKPQKKSSSVAKQLVPEISDIFSFEKNHLEPKSDFFYRNNLKIHFVIPDFGVGGGGHMTIFRMVRWLEYFGHEIKIWILSPSVHKTPEDAYDDIIRHYQTIKAKVSFLNIKTINNIHGDAIFATSWDTVWPVLNIKHFKRRFYLVQDHEPSFFAKGAKSELAKSTYEEDLDCICASTWLKALMENKYKRWASAFNLAFDKELFFTSNPKKHNKILRIAFYARIFTERRGVELGLIALDILAKKGVKFHVDFFGANLNLKHAPFSYKDHGVQPPEYLGNLYRMSDIGVVFSFTNYSLVPQEMMACGLPIVEFDGENTRSIYPEHAVSFAKPDPKDIAKKIEALILSSELREAQRNNALNWVSNFSWENSAKAIEESIIERLVDIGFKAETLEKDITNRVYASIVIPVLNGGDQIKELISVLESQETPWKFEIIILDSESNDGTLEFLQTKKNLTLKTIKRSDFNHGATRNFGAKISNGDFIAFLTQDAIPADKNWLYNIVTLLEHFPHAAGAFGKHIPHDDANFFTKLELKNHFDGFLHYPISVSKNKDIDKYNNSIQWRQMLHFYSDNNSCMRRSAFNKIPYRDVKYGEDQLWAKDIIDAGYEKIYAISAIVKHSHNYTPEEVLSRSEIDSDFFKFFFGYQMVDPNRADQIIEDLQKHDELLGYENLLSNKEIEDRLSSIKARIEGYIIGQQLTLSLFDKNNSKKSKF